MAKLREALEEAGFGDVLTHLQSGNVVLSSNTKPEQTARKCERLIKAEFGLEIDVVVRTSADLARVVKRDPLGKVATDPKCYQVSFLAGELPAASKRKLEEARKLVEDAVTALGSLEILVNNAGIEKNAAFVDVTEADYRAVIDVNMTGPFFSTQAFARHRQKAGGPGKVINNSSVHEELPFPHFTAYCASKGG